MMRSATGSRSCCCAIVACYERRRGRGAPAIVAAQSSSGLTPAGVHRRPRGVRWARGAQQRSTAALAVARCRVRTRRPARVPRIGHAVGVDHRASSPTTAPISLAPSRLGRSGYRLVLTPAVRRIRAPHRATPDRARGCRGSSSTTWRHHHPHRPGARRAPRRPARPHPPDRLARAASPAPHPPIGCTSRKQATWIHVKYGPRAQPALSAPHRHNPSPTAPPRSRGKAPGPEARRHTQ